VIHDLLLHVLLDVFDFWERALLRGITHPRMFLQHPEVLLDLLVIADLPQQGLQATNLSLAGEPLLLFKLHTGRFKLPQLFDLHGVPC